nr:UDP-glucose--hexose-1-phosphate uridylyltransferase [uncultured Cetobacterium sp.]
MKIYEYIQTLLNYALEKNLIPQEEEIYSRNLILDCLNLDSWENISKIKNSNNIEDILNNICQWSIENNLINDSPAEMELLDTKLMNCITPRPNEVIKKFNSDLKISPKIATFNYYNFSKDTNYIRSKRIEKNLHWYHPSKYGELEITINLAKPEKDPKDIEREKNMPKASYPSCLLCYENVGYTGRLNHPARQTHRVIPVTLSDEKWYLQFSPYVYYNEHSIVFSSEHRPMKINKKTFENLLEFVDIFPHYCIGSNADLPIVGGSILSHDHYQSGNHIFPMAKAALRSTHKLENFPKVEIGVVNWPISVLRLTSNDKNELIALCDYILNKWRSYTDLECNVIAYTGEVPHNTITPIARMVNGKYQIDLALRNNRTTDEHPLGLFHPHEEVHNIKKENIGLIEVMGLAILPGRLEKEMQDICKALKNNDWKIIIENNPSLNKHLTWIIDIVERRGMSINFEILKEEIGNTFVTVLEHAGVFKNTELGKISFEKFINML